MGGGAGAETGSETCREGGSVEEVSSEMAFQFIVLYQGNVVEKHTGWIICSCTWVWLDLTQLPNHLPQIFFSPGRDRQTVEH